MACVASQEVETSAVVRSASVQRGVHGVDCAPQGAQLEQPVAARARRLENGQQAPLPGTSCRQ